MAGPFWFPGEAGGRQQRGRISHSALSRAILPDLEDAAADNAGPGHSGHAYARDRRNSRFGSSRKQHPPRAGSGSRQTPVAAETVAVLGLAKANSERPRPAMPPASEDGALDVLADEFRAGQCAAGWGNAR